ncbi:MAG: hypothetical protein M3N34_07845 [Pseudomonadota bacterium]|nr:hypothetical protein [Pseudomonadota bacterium]
MNESICEERAENGSSRFSVLAYLALAIMFSRALIVRTSGRGIFFGGEPYWIHWADQGYYWQSALALAHGNLAASQHLYPPLYSMLIAPFVWMGPALATMLVDLGLYLACYTGFTSIARNFGIGHRPTLLIFICVTLLVPGVASSWSEPWTTTPSAALIFGSLALALSLNESDTEHRRRRTDLALGALLGLIPCARPGDVVVSALIGLFILWDLLVREREWVRLFTIIAGGALALVPYALLYLAIWGLAPSRYARGSSTLFEFGRLGWKAYLLLVEPTPWYPDSHGLLKALPWLVVSAAGALVALIRGEERERAALVLVPLAGYLVLMLAYVDLLPSGLWRFNNIHYFKWAILLLALFAWKFFTGFRAAPLVSIGSLAVVLSATCLRFDPVSIGPNGPARMIVYRSTNVPFSTVYFGNIAIRDLQGNQRNVLDIHAVPGTDGFIYVNSLRREFQGHEIIAASSLAGPTSSTVDGATSARAYGPLVGRFAAKRGWGVPCWIPGYNALLRYGSLTTPSKCE